MARSTVHYADNDTNSILKKLHNKLRPAGTPVQRVEYIIELLLLRIFEVKLKQDDTFHNLRKLFEEDSYKLLFSYLQSLTGEQILAELNQKFFPFYAAIISKARHVFEGNLPQKVQDQLVLIEEVFANSSFTANVKGGMMSEVIGLVGEIDEKRILSTDLLGDAIESALSETGGTKDIGLYRTPDHIRQMMVALVDPDFTDTIFDPACGTGGFLFDAFQYVLEKVSRESDWPGLKAHPELQAFFQEYFAKSPTDMPSMDVVNPFYRAGISGIEYLGMIRKMAAINMYIRGLNPHNIEQGDALKLFSPVVDGNSKSVVIANPPFGAERDQPAYANVWEEYSKESETTILFVKLMFELLKKGGRCTVVVSEGLLTWDHNSAKALRKMLLEEANLRAVISLPQGVFVSKGGQGAKTSILYFEKGGPTDFVWHYRVENDGYSMGVNRKAVDGCQFPEIVRIFHEYIRHGKMPPQTANSFIIPSDWIKTLDPRIKERIRKDTRVSLENRGKKKLEYLVKLMEDKLTKGKIGQKDYQEKLRQFRDNLENQIRNEIAKNIEKAHLYSFNLQNYLSDLTDQQIEEWPKVMDGIMPQNGRSLDHRYEALQTADPPLAMRILAAFNPRNALHVDIAKAYLAGIDEEALKKTDHLNRLDAVFKSGQAFPKAELRKLITPANGTITIEDATRYKLLTCKLHGQGVVFREYTRGEDIKTKSQQVVKENQLLVAEIDAKNGGYGVIHPDGDGAIVSSHYFLYDIDTRKLLPEYLSVVLGDRRIEEQVRVYVRGATSYAAIRANDFLNIKIPLPGIQIQLAIAEKVAKWKRIVEGAEKIINGYTVIWDDEKKYSFVNLNEIIAVEYGESFPADTRVEGKYPVVGAGNIIGHCNQYLIDGPAIIIGRRGATSGTVLWIEMPCYPIDTAFYVKVMSDSVNKKFLFYMLQILNLKQYQDGSAMPGINRDKIYQAKIPLPPIDIQILVVDQLDKETEALEKVRFLKEQAEKRIKRTLAEIWGEKTEENGNP
jgi:type I restriction-modification system DNA methylase subunit/restriction endonuclease S subunit